MSTFVGKGRGNVTAEEIDEWVCFVYQADDEVYDLLGGVAPSTIIEATDTEYRCRKTVRRHLEADARVEKTDGVGPRGPRLSFLPAVDEFEAVVEVSDA